VTGRWEGLWDGGAIGRGRIEMVLEQSGTRVAGELAMTGVQAISAVDGPLEGQVSGLTFSFSQPTGILEGQMEIQGDEMIGQTTGRLRVALRVRRQP
jgi:hypothetical protein